MLHAGVLVSVYAEDTSAPASAAPAKSCKTALDLIASQNMNLPLHPVFQNILNSEDLKGTIFIPTTKAWDQFFATMRQRQGNPAAPAMVARYGQILLYHLAKVREVPGVCADVCVLLAFHHPQLFGAVLLPWGMPHAIAAVVRLLRLQVAARYGGSQQ